MLLLYILIIDIIMKSNEFRWFGKLFFYFSCCNLEKNDIKMYDQLETQKLTRKTYNNTKLENQVVAH